MHMGFLFRHTDAKGKKKVERKEEANYTQVFSPKLTNQVICSSSYREE